MPTGLPASPQPAPPERAAGPPALDGAALMERLARELFAGLPSLPALPAGLGSMPPTQAEGEAEAEHAAAPRGTTSGLGAAMLGTGSAAGVKRAPAAPQAAGLAALLRGVSGTAPEHPTPASARPGSLRAPSGGAPRVAEPPPLEPLFDLGAARRDFPALAESVHGRPLAWLDNAAATQLPQAVIDRIAASHAREHAMPRRVAHELAARAGEAHERARETVRRFIGAASADEIVFTGGATEAINLVARSWGARHIGAGDEIVVSTLEHHANLVPWQQLAAERGARLLLAPVDDAGELDLPRLERLLGPRTRLVAVTHVSNLLGTVLPVRTIAELAHRAGARVLVDGAQSVARLRVDVRSLDADFFAFSGAKAYGPAGIGVLYGRRELLDAMPPWQGGAHMAADVLGAERSIYRVPPARFEAGSPNIAGATGLAAALEYLQRLGLETIGLWEHALLEHARRELGATPGVRLIGAAAERAGAVSFVLDGWPVADVARALDAEGIAAGAGHHGAQPALRRFGLEAAVRLSLAFYNSREDVDRAVALLRRLAGTRPGQAR